MDVFDLRRRLVDDFADYTRSFVVIRDERIRERVDRELAEGLLWPHPIVQLNPALACRYLGTDRAEGAKFTPLKVQAADFSATIAPFDDCREQRIFSSYAYKIPVPAGGQLRISAGNQSAVPLDSARLRRSGIATVFYAPKLKGGGFGPTVTRYRKDSEMKDAP